MNGCNWQEKSFSVAVNNQKTFTCVECKNQTDAIYKYNGDALCKDCFSLKPNKGISLETSFLTTRDKLFEFTDYNTTGKPVEIRTKGQWKKHLKKLGMHDDCDKVTRLEDIKPEKQEKMSREERNNLIGSDLKQSGFLDKLARDRRNRGR